LFLKRAALAAALFAFLGVVAAPSAGAKSFTLPRVLIDAELRPDATMRVVEHITYDFDGEFHHGTRPIPADERYSVVDMTVSEHGTPVPSHGAPYNLGWDYSARDEERTFDIAYTVVGAAKVGSDVGELYWQWVGGDHPPIQVVGVRLTVPGDGVGVRAWAHGPRNGVVRPGKVTTFDVTALPGGQYVEGRVAVPSAAFSVAPGAEARLPRILADEKRFIEQDAAERAREKRVRAAVQWAGLAFIPGLLGFLLIWKKWGDDPDPAIPVGEYVHEPLDDPPAVVDGLLHMGTVKPIAFSATVMDLAQRGHLTIEEVKEHHFLHDKKDWRFTQKESTDELQGWEKRILDRLFHDGPVTTQSDLTAWAKAHQSSARSFWEGFEKGVQRELKSRRYLMGGRALPFFLNFVLVALVGAAGIAAFSSGLAKGIILGALCELTAIVLAFGTLLLRSRTPDGAQRAAEWKAFAHFLRDFSRMEEAPVGHLILWERYLVYSVALGVSGPLAKALALRVPPEQSQSFAPWYIGSGGNGFGGRSFGSIGNFGDSFGSAVHSAMVPSSSGSGGGFSGGGGGGGGGGGIGAS
jgi:uncharacterized membrane protein